jgi:hypothetical protein
MSTTGTTAATVPCSTALRGFTDHVLRDLHCTELRAKIVVNEVAAMRIAVGVGFIDIEGALEHLGEIGALHLIEASS